MQQVQKNGGRDQYTKSSRIASHVQIPPYRLHVHRDFKVTVVALGGGSLTSWTTSRCVWGENPVTGESN